MYPFESTTGSGPALGDGGDGSQAGYPTFPDYCEAHESLSIPNRGIVLGGVLSSALWAALILAGRELWRFLH